MRTVRIGMRVLHVSTKAMGTVVDYATDFTTNAITRVKVRPDSTDDGGKMARLTWWRAEKVMEVLP